MHRADIQAAGDALISRDLAPEHGKLEETFTSGSTGRPIRVIKSQLWRVYWSAFTLRDHHWHRRDLRGKLATIRDSGKGKAPYPRGSRAAAWGRLSDSVFETGPCVGLNVVCTLDQQIEWLQREAPEYLLNHPSLAHRLAQHSMEKGIALPSLRQVETIAEVLSPATREACHRAWGVPVVDLYTARDAGYIALQCPEHEHDGRPCEPGEVGKVVLTPLHKFVMPLIRYDIGDYAEVGEPCPCGRGLPVLRRILGRKQNVLTLPCGEQRWPLLSSGDLRTLLAAAPIREYQFVQRRRDAIEVRLSVARPLASEEEGRLKQWVHEKFAYPFDVTLAYYASIPRTEAGKFQDFVSEVW